MTYRVEFTPRAVDDLSHLDRPLAARIATKIQWLAEQYEQLQLEPLTGNLTGFYKLRVGDWRVLYTADRYNTVLTVHLIAHRSKVYKL